ncbi:MAG: hypothetical protein VSS75_012485, partial [Candidatus Parabeggiatoa sp.]|nr:hypothetical protein [Candidatus Parabeggiatoa sp.]
MGTFFLTQEPQKVFFFLSTFLTFLASLASLASLGSLAFISNFLIFLENYEAPMLIEFNVTNFRSI